MRSFRPGLSSLLAASLVTALFGSAPAGATNGSDVQLTLIDTGVDPEGASGSVRLRAQRGEASLSLRLRRVDASPLHLCAGEDATSLVKRADLDADGATLTSTDGTLDFDPRGLLLAVSAAADCSTPLLEGRLDEPEDCTAVPRVKIGERTDLEPGTATPPAEAELLYMLLPDRNCHFAQGGSGKPLRKARLSLRVKHADPNATYDVCVDDVDRGDLATNAGGVGRADFRFVGGGAQGHGPHHAVLDFDVYGSHFEVRDDGDCAGDDASALFFGPLLAPLCAEDEGASADLVVPGVPPPPPTPSGEASLRRSDGCASELAVHVENLVPGTSYDLDVDPADAVVEGVGALATDASGAAEVVFSSDPAPGQLLLDFDAAAGQAIEVLQAGTVVLSGTLE